MSAKRGQGEGPHTQGSHRAKRGEREVPQGPVRLTTRQMWGQ